MQLGSAVRVAAMAGEPLPCNVLPPAEQAVDGNSTVRTHRGAPHHKSYPLHVEICSCPCLSRGEFSRLDHGGAWGRWAPLLLWRKLGSIIAPLESLGEAGSSAMSHAGQAADPGGSQD